MERRPRARLTQQLPYPSIGLEIPVMVSQPGVAEFMAEVGVKIKPGPQAPRWAKDGEVIVDLRIPVNPNWSPSLGYSAAQGWDVKYQSATSAGLAVVYANLGSVWAAITAWHSSSGAAVGRAFQVVDNVYQTGTLTDQFTIDQGVEMPASFRQGEMAQDPLAYAWRAL